MISDSLSFLETSGPVQAGTEIASGRGFCLGLIIHPEEFYQV
jgi:hypothetical protein